MANKVYNMDGGLHSSAALGGLEDAMYGSSVANSTSFVVTAGTGMNVTVSTGNGLISTGSGFARRIATDATNTVAITAASSTNPRIDSIVAYIDNGVTPTQTVLNNTNGILKFAAVAGSPNSTPVAPSSATVQTAVGAGNPYMVLYNVTVPKNATSLTTATFTDMRNVANIVSASDLANSSITTAKLASSAVTNAKLDFTTLYKSASVLGSDLSVTANTKTAVQTLILPVGKWRIIYLVRGFYQGNDPFVDSFLNNGSSDIVELAINAGMSGTDARYEVLGSAEVDINAQTTYKSMIKTPVASTVSKTSFLFAFRIG